MSINSVTLEMLAMLPAWMKMRSDPENSQGAKLLNAAGVQIYDIERLIDNILSAHHLEMGNIAEGLDILSIDIIYKVQLQEETLNTDGDISTPDEVYGILEGINHPLTMASSVYHFYESGDDKYYIDTDTNIIYFKKKFDGISYNKALYVDILEHHVWGPFDEIGLLLGCPRIPGEKNQEYRERLIDVFKNPGNSTRQGLINFLSRSFGIDKSEVIIQDLNDEFVQSLINEDGSLKPELKEYMLLSNKINLSSSDVYWSILEENRVGLSYLPILWNVSLSKWNDSSIQSGIGDTDDIEVIGPEQEKVIQNFTYRVGVEGLRVSKEQVYPEHKFKYRVFATGQKYEDGYKPENYRYSIIASELIPLKFKVKAHKHYSHDIQLSFGDAQVASYTSVTSADKKPTNYITKDVVIVPGSTVMNPNNRYIEILANLKTSDKSKTPIINSITLEYVAGGVTKKIKFDTQDDIIVNGNEITVGFTSNTWNDTDPAIKVRNDTNDNYNILTPAYGTVTLARGEYQRVYNSEGDWDDGETINLRTTSSGTLKLSI